MPAAGALPILMAAIPAGLQVISGIVTKDPGKILGGLLSGAMGAATGGLGGLAGGAAAGASGAAVPAAASAAPGLASSIGSVAAPAITSAAAAPAAGLLGATTDAVTSGLAGAASAAPQGLMAATEALPNIASAAESAANAGGLLGNSIASATGPLNSINNSTGILASMPQATNIPQVGSSLVNMGNTSVSSGAGLLPEAAQGAAQNAGQAEEIFRFGDGTLPYQSVAPAQPMIPQVNSGNLVPMDRVGGATLWGEQAGPMGGAPGGPSDLGSRGLDLANYKVGGSPIKIPQLGSGDDQVYMAPGMVPGQSGGMGKMAKLQEIMKGVSSAAGGVIGLIQAIKGPKSPSSGRILSGSMDVGLPTVPGARLNPLPQLGMPQTQISPTKIGLGQNGLSNNQLMLKLLNSFQA